MLFALLLTLGTRVIAKQQSPPARVEVKLEDYKGGGVPGLEVLLKGINVQESYQGATNQDGIVVFEDVNTPVRNHAYNPESFQLSKPWPNPSNGKVNFKFQLPRPDNVKLKVYNVLGQEVVSQQEMLNSGAYEAKLQGLPSGVYILRVSTSKESYTGKFTVIQGSGTPSITVSNNSGFKLAKAAEAASYALIVDGSWINHETKKPVSDTVTVSSDTSLSYIMEKNHAPSIQWISPKADTTMDDEDSLEVKVAVLDSNQQTVQVNFWLNNQYLGKTTVTTPETLQTKLTFQDAKQDTTLRAKLTVNDGYYTTTSTSPQVKVKPRARTLLKLKPLFTPQIDSSFTTPPPIDSGKVIIAQLDGTDAPHPSKKYTLYELYDVPPDVDPPLRPDKLLDTLEVDSATMIPMKPGEYYRFIIRIPGYHEYVTGNLTFTTRDTSMTVELADTTNLPKQHSSIVAYGHYPTGIGAGIERIIHMDSVYISTLPAKGSGNPVPQEYIDIIRSIYEKDLQGEFIHTSLYPDGPLANIKVVVGDNPPEPGTPGVILWQADDTIPFYAEFGHRGRGFANCEMYSIDIEYRVGEGNDPERFRRTALHEAASLFNRRNSSPYDEVPSIFDDPNVGVSKLTRADKALLRWIFSRPLNPDLGDTPYYPNATQLRFFDRMYR